ncbi:MAG: TIGR02281 family clan AA aspartic protease [Rhizomicrobium sp.]
MSEPAPWGQPQKPRRKASRLGLALWLGALVVLGLSLWSLSENFPNDGLSGFDAAMIVRMVAILAVISSGLLFVREINLKQTIRNILMWTGIAGVLALGFSYQEPLREAAMRLRSGFIPGEPVHTGAREMVISESEGGNYLIYGTVNGARVRFLVDTGASDIVLSPSDARRAGIDFGLLDFAHSYETANGVGKGALTNVKTLAVGDASFTDVAISVNQADMNASLLGMTFLRKFKSFSFSQGKLTLTW